MFGRRALIAALVLLAGGIVAKAGSERPAVRTLSRAGLAKVSDYIRKTCIVGPVTGVQGEGFLLGLRTTKPAKEIHAQLLEVGILAGTSTDPNILRLLPPFILEEQHVDMLVDALSHLP